MTVPSSVGRTLHQDNNEREDAMSRFSYVLLLTVVFASGSSFASAQGAPQASQMTFFITSAGPGNGANLGGVGGADKHCQMLAQAAGAGNRTWRAYLSTSASGNQPATNARDRIGSGPWVNVKGERVAQNVDDLH